MNEMKTTEEITDNTSQQEFAAAGAPGEGLVAQDSMAELAVVGELAARAVAKAKAPKFPYQKCDDLTPNLRCE